MEILSMQMVAEIAAGLDVKRTSLQTMLQTTRLNQNLIRLAMNISNLSIPLCQMHFQRQTTLNRILCPRHLKLKISIAREKKSVGTRLP